MKDDNKNVYLAIALSILVIIGWNFFYGWPQMERQRQAQLQNKTAAAGAPVDPSSTPSAATSSGPPLPGATNASPPQGAASQPAAGSAPETTQTREAALAESPRILVDTPNIAGSINLKGGRIDDVSLKAYHETTDKQSPIIELFSPSSSPHPYYSETGFIPEAGQTPVLPGHDTLWTADGDKLTPEKPLTLTWDNQQGLVFHRSIAVDDQYMFTVKDSVENKGTAPVSLYPYALISRHGKPVTSNYSVLHEGLVGEVGDGREQQITYDAMDKEAGGSRTVDGTGGWLGITDKYWAAVVAPEQDASFKGRFSVFPSGTMKDYQTDALQSVRAIAPGQTTDVTTHVFAGAKETDTLNKYEKEYGIKNFGNLIDWGWFYFITKPLFQVLDFFYKLTGNFGVAILIVTVLIKGLFFPLANKSYMSMAKMKKLQPQLAAMKERYPDDKQKQQEETMAMYKREKVNPVAGCLPMIIQVPVFFRALQGDLHHDRDAACAVLRLDPRPVGPGPHVHLHAVRHPSDRALPAELPADRHLAGDHGLLHVPADEDEPGAPRSGPEDDVLVDARHLHLHARIVSLGPRHLLDLEQHAVRDSAISHRQEGRRQGGTLGQPHWDVPAQAVTALT